MRGDRAAERPALPSPLLLLLLLSRAAALHPGELFPYGESRGDQVLQEGDDESSAAVQLAIPLRFYEAQFSSLYVGTNGVISTQDFPRETQYVDDDFPTDFPAIAPFLADIDTSHGRGRVLYREDASPAVLGPAARYVRTGFPCSAKGFAPTHAFLATWEQVGAYEEVTRGASPSGELNTFQAVLVSNESDTYALFLYPANGLQFFGTRPKESYNVQLQLPARVGFSQGEVDNLKRGVYFSLTSTEQSVKNLSQLSNLGIPGVWVFHIGSTSPLDNVRPATIGGHRSTAHSLAPPENPLSHNVFLESDYTEDNLNCADENEEEVEYPPSKPEEALNGRKSIDLLYYLKLKSNSGPLGESVTLDPQTKEGSSLEKAEAQDLKGQAEPLNQTGTRSLAPSEVDGDSLAPSQETPPPYPGNRSIQPYPDGGAVLSERGVPPAHPEDHSPPVSHERNPVGVEDYDSSNTRGNLFYFSVSKVETCEHNHGQCSWHAFCTDYATGFCCHCQSKYFGNGKHCLPEGTPHRINGKVSGHLHVGQTPVHFTDVDMHAYVVGNDGRAYMAISDIPQPAAKALLPLTSIIGLLGWLFALERPGSENGFSLTGATFVHNMEVAFYPGEERVRITQTAEGLDPENSLSIKTSIQGQVPHIPEDFIVITPPYKEFYRYSDSVVTSTSSRNYFLRTSATEQTQSFHINQNVTYQVCRHATRRQASPNTQQLSVNQVIAMYSERESMLRFSVTSQIGPVEEESDPTPVNPCYRVTHGCDRNARCLPGTGVDYTCECAPGFQGDGKSCVDINECDTGSHRCGPNSECINFKGSYRCECQSGYELADDRHTCILIAPPPSSCEDGSHCVPAATARCIHYRGRKFGCTCLPGYTGDGHHCADIDECSENRCHPAATCYNTPGSFSCRCKPGYHGDGFQCTPESTQRPQTVCERWRENLLEQYGGTPRDDQYMPQCDDLGHFIPLQCHGKSDFCWCVDKDGREVQGTRSHPGTTPACVPTVAPPVSQPEVTPSSVGTTLLYAQGQQIGQLPLNGTKLQKGAAKTLLSLRGSIVVGIDYDCQERMVYWTDVVGQTISRASLEPGAEPETIINSGLISPEGLVVDHFHRTMYWTDSVLDRIERAKLDGSERRALFHTDLVNPRAIAVDPSQGNLYWTDWNREAPKIETSSLDGENRRILVNKDIGLPNGLTFDPFSKLLCWADAGTKKLECVLPDGTGRHVIHNHLNYPFGIVSYADHFYLTDWRRDGVISLHKDSSQFIDEYLPEQRSHLYGITAVYPFCLGK
ncbi:nidogen-2 [Cynocephalus volans]|uniref:nidogen-2 n=1 Tax=Cynocephalus volans TaxID=110931 RepID=UPI002FC5C34D